MFSANSSQVSNDANYIEDVFSTYLYTGTGADQTITNGIDLSTKGGLVWIKDRSAANSHVLHDSARGVNNRLITNNTNAQSDQGTVSVSAFNTTGFSIGTSALINTSAATLASWTFRKQPKFFDVVTYTGTGANRTIAHALGSTPGCVIVKRTDTTGNWQVYHNSLTSAAYSIQLNLTNAQASATTVWNSTAPTSTVFSVGTDATVNASGGTYVAYLFAHDAGGFGLTGTDNVISCGSYTDNGTDQFINLGYEPQWILVKDYASSASWRVIDNMRGWNGQPVTATASVLTPNTSAAEVANGAWLAITQTGFQIKSGSSLGNSSFIYIAIRRGPMKVPTSGTSVFSPVAQNASNPTSTITTGFPVDFAIATLRGKSPSTNTWAVDRLRGSSKTSGLWLNTNRDVAEQTLVAFGFDNNSGYIDNFFGNATDGIGATSSVAYWNFRRAPSFFDEVCYTGTGSARTISHNLGVAPELMIVKARVSAGGADRNWAVYASSLGAGTQAWLNTTDAAFASSTIWANTSPTASVFSVSTNVNTNYSGATYVAYLFATCAGVSKVGSYTGTGTTKQVDCGFTGGARFVLIKRTDSTGDWYVWDTARGIVAGNDPYLLLNSTAAETTTTDYIDTYSAGFEISSTAPAAINASGGTFIFLAIA